MAESGPRTPHVPQIVQGPLAARPSAATTPSWLWYYAWDEGAFHRATPEGWLRATAPVAGPWCPLDLTGGWDGDPMAAPAAQRQHDRVVLRGVARNSGVSDPMLARLPEGMRPAVPIRIPVGTDTGLAVIDVGANGGVLLTAPDGQHPARAVYLDAVGFAIG